MRGPASRLVTAAAVLAGLAVIAVAGRLLPIRSGAGSSATTGVVTPVSSSIPREQVLVPQVVGRRLAEAKAVMRRAGLPSGAVEIDSQAPGAVVVAQEPPAGIRVPPRSPVGFRTRTDVWPNGVPRRLRLGQGATTATYRVVAADPAHDALTVIVTLPRGLTVRVWLDPGSSYSGLPVLDTGNPPPSCRPAGDMCRCRVTFAALGDAPVGVWTVGVATGSTQAAVVQVTVEFTPPRGG